MASHFAFQPLVYYQTMRKYQLSATWLYARSHSRFDL
jgi:hypothetical protein